MERNEKLQALANYLGVEPNYFEEESYDENLFESKEYNEEYLVLTEDEAREYADRYIRDLFDDMGFESFTPSFQDWIMDKALDQDVFDSIIEDEIDYFTNQEPDENSLEYVKSFKDRPIEYARELFDGKSFYNFVVENNAIDMDTVVEECISQDGVAHFIAFYDGNEIDLGNGLFAYRTN